MQNKYIGKTCSQTLVAVLICGWRGRGGGGTNSGRASDFSDGAWKKKQTKKVN